MTLQSKRIVFIGAGNMGETMIRGLLKSGLAKPEGLLASDLQKEKLEALGQELKIKVAPNAAEAVAEADIVVVAVKPQSVSELLPQLKAGIGKRRPLILSIVAGLRLEAFEKGLGSLPMVRVMPNTPALLGLGASAYCLGPHAELADGDNAEAILSCFGIALEVKEEQMDAVTALSGSGPAYVFLFMESLVAAGEALGLSAEQCFRLAAQTLKGAAAMIELGQDSPARLREKVTSPGGTTAAALKVFEEAKFRELVLRAMTAARDRGSELGR